MNSETVTIDSPTLSNLMKNRTSLESQRLKPLPGAGLGRCVWDLLSLKLSDRLRIDHSPVSSNAKLSDVKASTDTLCLREKSSHIDRIAWPHLAADRFALAIDHDPDNHLVQIRWVIFAVPLVAQGFPSLSFKVDGGGIKKHQVKTRKQIPSLREHPLFMSLSVSMLSFIANGS